MTPAPLLTTLAALFGIGVALPTTNNSIMVAALAGHDPSAWVKGSVCSSSSQDLIRCNLNIYALAIQKAAAAGAQMIVLPEGYGTVGSPSKASFFEPMLSVPGERLCGNVTVSTISPQQYHLSCHAQIHSIAVAANVFVSLANGDLLELLC